MPSASIVPPPWGLRGRQRRDQLRHPGVVEPQPHAIAERAPHRRRIHARHEVREVARRAPRQRHGAALEPGLDLAIPVAGRAHHREPQ
jgi:hypothetical protein